jgi:hypothetical protein
MMDIWLVGLVVSYFFVFLFLFFCRKEIRFKHWEDQTLVIVLLIPVPMLWPVLVAVGILAMTLYPLYRLYIKLRGGYFLPDWLLELLNEWNWI